MTQVQCRSVAAVSGYAVAYMNHIRSLYDENGKMMDTDCSTFMEIVEECKAQKENEHRAELEAARQKTILYISVGTGAAVLCAAAATILLLRRRKKH